MKENLILLVDDSPLIVAMMSDLLINAGYEVISASDGVEAINKAYSELPDLILLDVMMPKMNGYQVCRLLKNDEYMKYIPIIMFTTRDKPIEKFWGLHIGADEYVSKDIEAEKLLKLISKYIDRLSDYKHILKKKVKNITLTDILLKTNNILDSKLYELTIINRITSIAWKTKNFREVIINVLQILEEIFNYELGAFCLLDEGKLSIFITTNAKIEMKDINIIDNFCRKQIISVGEALKEDKSKVYILKSGEKEIYIDENNLFAFNFKSGNTNIYRSLVFLDSQLVNITDTEKNTYQLILEQALVVIENAYLYEKIRLRSVTDELTRLYNRRYFFVRVNEECERVNRYGGGWFSVLILDIDHFKQVNDTYGHLAGDEVLREIAKILKTSVRSTDVPARFGGEEFIVLLPETDLQGGLKFAERIRKKIEEYTFKYKDKTIPVTVSIGVASGGCKDNNRLPDVIIGQADKALYKAKDTGRNRVCIYDETA